jgi:hypothetical protein
MVAGVFRVFRLRPSIGSPTSPRRAGLAGKRVIYFGRRESFTWKSFDAPSPEASGQNFPERITFCAGGTVNTSTKAGGSRRCQNSGRCIYSGMTEGRAGSAALFKVPKIMYKSRHES